MRRFRHTDSSAGDSEKKRSRFDEKAASRKRFEPARWSTADDCGGFEILPRAWRRDRQ
jgi:hypothetical protein